MKRNALSLDRPSVSFSRALAGMALLTGGFYLHAAEPAPVSAGPQAVRPGPAPGSEAEMQAARAAYLEREKKWEEAVTLELVGVGQLAGVPVGLLAVDGNLCAIMSGIFLAGRRVEEIDVEKKQVTLRRRDKSSAVLTLTTVNPIKIPEMHERQIEYLLSKEGIKQVNASRGIPMELHNIWDKVTREGQAEVLLRYLRRGLVVGAVKSEGYSACILEKQITQRMSEKRKAFVASLTDEQKAAYDTRQALVSLREPPRDRDQQMAVAQAAKTRQEEVVANLTPEQRVLYDEYQSWVRP